MLNPTLVEALESVAVAVVGSGIVAPIASRLKRSIGQAERMVALKMPSGKEVRLELDGRLSSDQISELVAAAICSAQAGDDRELIRTIAASHAASAEARATAAGLEDAGKPAR